MHMNDTDLLGNRLKMLRQLRNLTQEQVASVIGVTAKAISSYESGLRQPSFDVLLSLASYYHVSTDYLLGVSADYVINAKGLDGKEYALLVELVNGMKNKNAKLDDKQK